MRPKRLLLTGAAGEIGRVLGRAKRAEIDDDDALEELIQRAAARICNDAVGKKPIVTVMISRLEE